MKRNLLRLALVAGVIVTSFVTVVSQLQADADAKTKPDAPLKRAPDWELKDLNGKTVKLSDFKGKVVILDFWATWCGPCEMEIPSFVALQKKYRDQGLVVIGASLDEGEPKQIKSFVERLAINYPIVMADKTIADAYGGIEAIPATFVIDRQGMIVRKHVGYSDQAQFEAEIKPLLKL